MRSLRLGSSVSGSTMSVLWIAPRSSRIVRGLLPSPARLCHCSRVFQSTLGEEANQDVGLHPIRSVAPDRADRQLGLLDPEGSLGLGELHVGAPQRPLYDRSPLVPAARGKVGTTRRVCQTRRKDPPTPDARAREKNLAVALLSKLG
jgi:hypothetical protein